MDSLLGVEGESFDEKDETGGGSFLVVRHARRVLK